MHHIPEAFVVLMSYFPHVSSFQEMKGPTVYDFDKIIFPQRGRKGIAAVVDGIGIHGLTGIGRGARQEWP